MYTHTLSTFCIKLIVTVWLCSTTINPCTPLTCQGFSAHHGACPAIFHAPVEEKKRAYILAHVQSTVQLHYTHPMSISWFLRFRWHCLSKRMRQHWAFYLWGLFTHYWNTQITRSFLLAHWLPWARWCCLLILHQMHSGSIFAQRTKHVSELFLNTSQSKLLIITILFYLCMNLIHMQKPNTCAHSSFFLPSFFPDHDVEVARPPSGAHETTGGGGANTTLQYLLQGNGPDCKPLSTEIVPLVLLPKYCC